MTEGAVVVETSTVPTGTPSMYVYGVQKEEGGPNTDRKLGCGCLAQGSPCWDASRGRGEIGIL